LLINDVQNRFERRLNLKPPVENVISPVNVGLASLVPEDRSDLFVGPFRIGRKLEREELGGLALPKA